MKGGRGKGGKGTGTTPSPSPSRKAGAGAKLMRKWGDSSVSAGDMAALDYSTPAPDSPANGGHATPIDVEALVSRDAMGQRSKDGQYEVADWDFRGGKREALDLPSEEEILARGTSQLSIKDEIGAGQPETTSSWSGIFARLTGSKVLSQQDLQPVLAEMEKHLMGKNVAKDISEKMCDAVGSALVGKKLGGLSSGYIYQ